MTRWLQSLQCGGGDHRSSPLQSISDLVGNSWSPAIVTDCRPHSLINSLMRKQKFGDMSTFSLRWHSFWRICYFVWRVFRTIGKYTPQEGHSKKFNLIGSVYSSQFWNWFWKMSLWVLWSIPLWVQKCSVGIRFFWFCRFLGEFEPAYPVGRWRGARKKQSFHLEKEPVNCLITGQFDHFQ